MQSYKNISTWNEKNIDIEPGEIYTVDYVNIEAPNMFAIINPDNAELKISISKIPTPYKYEFIIHGSSHDIFGRPTRTRQFYILNDSSIKAHVKIFSTYDKFNIEMLKAQFLSVDSLKTVFDGIVRGFQSDVMLPSGTNTLGKVEPGNKFIEKFNEFLSKDDSIIGSLTQIVGRLNNLLNLNDLGGDILQMLESIKTNGIELPDSLEVDANLNLDDFYKRTTETIKAPYYKKYYAGLPKYEGPYKNNYDIFLSDIPFQTGQTIDVYDTSGTPVDKFTIETLTGSNSTSRTFDCKYVEKVDTINSRAHYSAWKEYRTLNNKYALISNTSFISRDRYEKDNVVLDMYAGYMWNYEVSNSSGVLLDSKKIKSISKQASIYEGSTETIISDNGNIIFNQLKLSLVASTNAVKCEVTLADGSVQPFYLCNLSSSFEMIADIIELKVNTNNVSGTKINIIGGYL